MSSFIHIKSHIYSHRSSTMPVTIKPANHAAELIPAYHTSITDSFKLLEDACPSEHKDCNELLQSSFASLSLSPISPFSNGFVHTALEAYSYQYHLQIRPEDVWFAIVAQPSFYINRHAKELRVKLVGKKTLTVVTNENRYTIDFGRLAQLFTVQIKKSVVNPELRKWCMPAFSTTTENDTVVASILLMGVVKKIL